MGFTRLLLQPYVLVLVAINSYLVYRFLGRFVPASPAYTDGRDYGSCGGGPPPLAEPFTPLAYREYLIGDLASFDGVQHAHILIALDMRVYDVTQAKHLYGPGTAWCPELTAERL